MSESNITLPTRSEAEARRDIAFKAMFEVLGRLRDWDDLGKRHGSDHLGTLARQDVEGALILANAAIRATSEQMPDGEGRPIL